MLSRTAILWIAYAAIIGFVAGASLFSPQIPPAQNQAVENGNTAAQKSATQVTAPKTTDERIATYTWYVAAFTCALVIVSAIQIHFLIRSDETASITAKSAQDAADVARQTLIAGQRAWIRIDQVELCEPLSFTSSGSGARTAISFNFTNIGNAPALLVKQHAWLFLMEMKPSPRIQPIDEQTRLCEKVKTEAFRELHAVTLFPGESLPKPGGIIGRHSIGVSVPRDEIDAAIEGKPNISVPFVIAGCVDYSFPTDPKSHHQTRFLFTLIKKPPAILRIGTTMRGIRPEDGKIAANDLMLLDFLGGGWAD